MSKKRPILLYGFYQKHLVGRRHQRTGSVFLRLVQKLSGISRPPWMNQQIRSILLFENLIFLQFRLASLKGERLSLHGGRTRAIMHLVMPRVWSANKISLLLLMWKTMCIRSRDMQAILERCFFCLRCICSTGQGNFPPKWNKGELTHAEWSTKGGRHSFSVG